MSRYDVAPRDIMEEIFVALIFNANFEKPIFKDEFPKSKAFFFYFV